ncbi:unnamed protein product [Schistocephalus solidus]|uniref:C2H2-type domain-containing protein n=1 Tax=Schistocephalus solidus TaxID=70667 RepID=A0A183SF18_SCHSO|nr:unnamed protein product [Schistocephalus solidus]
MGSMGHMRIQESGIQRDASISYTPINTSHIPPMSSTASTAADPPDSAPHLVLIVTAHANHASACRSRIGLVVHSRIHRRETGEPVAGAPTYTYCPKINCPHCPHTFTHGMGLGGHVRLYEN